MADTQQFIVPEETLPLRLDLFLSDQLEGISRTKIQGLIKEGQVSVNGKIIKKPSFLVSSGDHVVIELAHLIEETELVPENIPLDILYEDKDVIVINKQAGLVVHPASGHTRGTLVNALLYHCRDFVISGDPQRPGIVHRLDMYTSGVLVVAKNPESYFHLRKQVEDRAFTRRYYALVKGIPRSERGVIDASIGQSLSNPKLMSITGINARDARTHFRVLEKFPAISFLELKLDTGRTHQIRVHLRFIGNPILGDPVYGFTDYSALGLPQNVILALQKLPGQALHAGLLGFTHPTQNTYLEFSAPLPEYFQNALNELRKSYSS